MAMSRSYASTSSTHHRKSSSRAQANGTSPNGTSGYGKFANDHHDAVEDAQVPTGYREKRPGPFAFAGNESFSSVGFGTRYAGSQGSSTPQSERLDPIIEDTYRSPPKPAGESSSTRTTPTAIRTSPIRHRITPSLPYGPFESKSQPHPASASSAAPSHAHLSVLRIIYLNLRRARWLDLIYAIAFVTCVVAFFSALTGIGYDGPPPGPLQTPPPKAYAHQPRNMAPVRVGTRAPLVIKEDLDESAKQDAERPVFARGRGPPLPPVQQKPQYPPKHVPAPLRAQYANAQPLAPPAVRPVIPLPHPPADESRMTEPEDHGPELVGDSPADKHLDDAHAAHYHHPPENNVFRGAAAGSDPQQTDHDESSEGRHHRYRHAGDALAVRDEGHKIVDAPALPRQRSVGDSSGFVTSEMRDEDDGDDDDDDDDDDDNTNTEVDNEGEWVVVESGTWQGESSAEAAEDDVLSNAGDVATGSEAQDELDLEEQPRDIHVA